MNHAVLLGQIAGALAMIAFIPYIRSIFKGRTKPERATFAIWSLVSIVTFISYFASGARETIWVAGVYAFFQILVFLLSFKYGVGGTNRLDILCLIGAFLGIILWIVTKDPRTALYITIFVEILGFIPTIKKAYLYPKTENTASWTISTFANFLNLFAITSFKLEIIIYPVYVFLFDAIISLLTVFPKFRLQRK